MPTRQERLRASLKKENRRLDLNRLKKAEEFLGLASTVLNGKFHDPEFNRSEFESFIKEMHTRIDFDCAELQKRVLKG